MERTEVRALTDDEADFYKENRNSQSIKLLEKTVHGRMYRLDYVCGVGTVLLHGGAVYRIVNPFKLLDETILEADEELYGTASPRSAMRMPWIMHAMDTELSRWSTGDVRVWVELCAVSSTEYAAALKYEAKEESEGLMHAPNGMPYYIRGRTPYAAMEALERLCRDTMRVD